MKTDKLIIPNNIDIRDINNNYYDFENNISYYFHDVENPSFNELNNEEKAAIIKDMSFNIDFHGEYNDEYNADLYHTEPLPLQYLKERLDKKGWNNNYYFDLNNAGQARHYAEVIKEYKEDKNQKQTFVTSFNSIINENSRRHYEFSVLVPENKAEEFGITGPFIIKGSLKGSSCSMKLPEGIKVEEDKYQRALKTFYDKIYKDVKDYGNYLYDKTHEKELFLDISNDNYVKETKRFLNIVQNLEKTNKSKENWKYFETPNTYNEIKEYSVEPNLFMKGDNGVRFDIYQNERKKTTLWNDFSEVEKYLVLNNPEYIDDKLEMYTLDKSEIRSMGYKDPLEIIDEGIENIQSNHGSSETALERDYEASLADTYDEDVDDDDNYEYPFIVHNEIKIPHPFSNRSIGTFYVLETDPIDLKNIYPDMDKLNENQKALIEYTKYEDGKEIFSLNLYENKNGKYIPQDLNKGLISGYSFSDGLKENIKEYINEIEFERKSPLDQYIILEARRVKFYNEENEYGSEYPKKEEEKIYNTLTRIDGKELIEKMELQTPKFKEYPKKLLGENYFGDKRCWSYLNDSMYDMLQNIEQKEHIKVMEKQKEYLISSNKTFIDNINNCLPANKAERIEKSLQNGDKINFEKNCENICKQIKQNNNSNNNTYSHKRR